jgi:3'-5' exoribonuclease
MSAAAPQRRQPTILEWLGDAPFPWPALAGLGEGERVVACFYVAGRDLLRTRQEKPYLKLRLCDRHGTIEGRVWDDAERVDAALAGASFVGVRGLLQVYQGERQLRIDQIASVEVSPDQLDLFLPRSRREPADMERELRALVGSIQDSPLRRLVEAVLDVSTDVGRAFRAAPAAKLNHHAYVGGLLEHTLSVVHACDLLAGHYGRDIDRDLLLCGALLHDVGKVREIASAAGFPYTDEGKLLGHILLGIDIVRSAAARVPELSGERLTLVLHLIASHQGRYEWQSPKRPKILEALLLHYVDDLDAKLQQAAALLAGTAAGWSAYDRSLGRELFRHLPPGAPPQAEPQHPAGDPGDPDPDPYDLDLFRR